jgi:prevent-host-death family protein
MQYISASNARAAFSDVIAKAQKEPVMIQRQHKNVAVMISSEEYEKLRRVRTRELDDLCRRASAYAKKQGLSEKKLAALLADES